MTRQRDRSIGSLLDSRPARSAQAPTSRQPDTGTAAPATAPAVGPFSPRRVRTAAITNLGCKVNQSEMEAASRFLRAGGVTLVDDDRPADLYLINTCTVTSTADQKSRQAVRRARRANPDAEIVVTGCSVQVGPEVFAAVDPAAHLVDNLAKERLPAELAALAGLDEAGEGPLGRALPTLSGVEVAEGAPADGPGWLNGIHFDVIADDRTVVDRTRAFIKVQDGCSFYCTYCIIPRARGHERSLPPDVVLADVRRALAAGHREIVLTGINIGTYDGGASERGSRGAHRWAALTLVGLVRRILDETDVERIRLSSIEPQHVDDELLEVWAEAPSRCLPHLHLPLQSGDDGVLRRMGRRYDSAGYAAVVERARAAIPDLAVHADAIAGFPTEDEGAWQRSIAFIRSLELAGLHVFRYSARSGTPATRMAGQVDEATKRHRAAEFLALGAECRARFAARQIGAELSVLFETRLPDDRWLGHAGNYVAVAVPPPGADRLGNAIGRVRVTGIDPVVADRVVGRLVSLDRPSGGSHG